MLLAYLCQIEIYFPGNCSSLDIIDINEALDLTSIRLLKNEQFV